MTPTLFVLRVEGHGAPDHLSLHTGRQQALDRLSEVGRKLWRGRFDYELPGSDLNVDDGAYVSDRLVREGWRVRLTEEPVEL